MTEFGRLGRYRLLRRIAVGGVAEVYLAAAEGLAGFSKRVVVKRLHPELARDAELVAMFMDEARLGALLHHPHIVEVYDIGSDGRDYFIAMEHVPGRDLRDLLDARPQQPLPLPVALRIVAAVAGALHHAHEQRDSQGQLLGVVHRDVSPANVLVGRDGAIKLSDFGVAKWAAQRSRTEQGTLKGKLGYMSPEQCRGEALDRRSDVFALGVLLYELATGTQPFRVASDFETMSAIVAGRYRPPAEARPDLPAALAAIIERALAVAPDGRYADAAAFATAVGQVAAGLDAPATAEDIARCLVDRFPEDPAEHDPTPAPIAASAPAAATAERTRTDAAAVAPPPGTAAPSRRLAPWVAAGVALVITAGLVFAVTWDDPDPAAPRPAARTAATPAPRAPAAPPPAPALAAPGEPAKPAGAAAAKRRPPARTARPTSSAPSHRVVWDPDSPTPP